MGSESGLALDACECQCYRRPVVFSKRSRRAGSARGATIAARAARMLGMSLLSRRGDVASRRIAHLVTGVRVVTGGVR